MRPRVKAARSWRRSLRRAEVARLGTQRATRPRMTALIATSQSPRQPQPPGLLFGPGVPPAPEPELPEPPRPEEPPMPIDPDPYPKYGDEPPPRPID